MKVPMCVRDSYVSRYVYKSHGGYSIGNCVHCDQTASLLGFCSMNIIFVLRFRC
jgi:hypothetical protein